MNHKQYQELLHLSFFDELKDDERRMLDDHLPICSTCRQEFEELKKLHSAMAKQKSLEPSEELLREARQELRAALRLERSRGSVWSGLLDRFSVVAAPQVRVALGGLATLVVGVFVGYLVFTPSSQEVERTLLPTAVSTLGQKESTRGETRITNVRFIDSDTQDGQIEFTFEATTPMRVRGAVNDESVQKVLAQALLSEQNPGARLRTVSTLASFAEQANALDVEIKSALIQALKYDVNVGVRKEALRSLQKFPMDQDLKQALLYVLRSETNPAMRIDVINTLERPLLEGGLRDPDILNALKEKMQSDENNYIRIRATNVYEEAQQK